MRVDQNTAPQPPSSEERIPGEVGMDREESLEGPGGSSGTPSNDIIPDFTDEDTEGDTPEAPVQPTPSDSETPTPEASAPVETIDKILERYKNSPEELAKALYNAQAALGRQGNELGNLRKQVQQPQQAPQEQQPQQPAATQQAPQEQQPPQQQSPVSFHIPTPQERQAIASLPRDPDTGLPTYNGQQYELLDSLGIPERDIQYWQARAAQMEEQYPDATDRDILLAIQNEQRQFDQWRSHQVMLRTGELERAQETMAVQHTASLVTQLRQMFPENVAQAMAGEFRRVAKDVLADARRKGVSPEEVNDPEAMAKAMNLYYFTLFSNGGLIPLAERIAATLPQGNISVQGRQSVPGQPAISPPSIGGNGASGGNGVRKGAKPLVESNFLKSDEVDKYLSDDFSFDGI